MPTIAARCSFCQYKNELHPANVIVYVDGLNVTVRWTCESVNCGQRDTTIIDIDMVDRVRGLGALVIYVDSMPGLAPITPDDLLDAHIICSSGVMLDNWLAGLAQPAEKSSSQGCTSPVD